MDKTPFKLLSKTGSAKRLYSVNDIKKGEIKMNIDKVGTPSKVIGDGGAKPAVQTTLETTRWLALGAVAGPVLFTLAWLVLGFLSPGFTIFRTLITPYSPISAGISGLGLGLTAPFMNAAFVLGGLFTLESFFPHLIGFLLGAATPVLSFLVTGFLLRRIPRWRRFGSWLLLGSPLTLALLILYFLTFSPTAAGARSGVAGLTERILVSEVFGWFVALGWLAFRFS
jgi:hypothetical protein